MDIIERGFMIRTKMGFLKDSRGGKWTDEGFYKI